MKQYKRAYVEITNICNLNCSFCPITERDKNFMELSKFEETIKQVSPLADQVCLHLMGEPLAHPQFNEILGHCEQNQALIQLTTNGILLKKYSRDILSSPIVRQVNISIQSYMDNFPHKDLTPYLEEIFSFIQLAQNKKPELYINIRLWNIEDDEKKENEEVFKFFENKLNIQINRKLELGRIKSKKLVDRLYLHFDSRFEWPRLDLPFQSKEGRCNGLIDHFAIHADGVVVPCCLDDQKILDLGNIFEKPLQEILNSQKALSIAQGFKQNKLCEDLCQKCTYISRFRK